MRWPRTRPEGASLGSRRPSARVYLWGAAVYLLVLSVAMFWFGGFVEGDSFLLFLLLGAIVMGQTRSFLRDWTPFVVLFFGWQMLRGPADQNSRGAGATLHIADLIAGDRWLFHGHVPTVVLQQWLYTPGKVHVYDIVATAFYAFHFALPLLFAYLLWIRDRALYWRFVVSLLVLSFAAFLTFIVFPAVPPWLASEWHYLPQHVYLIRDEVLRQSHFGLPLSWAARYGNPNVVACMPSLHAAYPTLILLFCLFHWRAVAPVMVLYCLGIWFSVVYIGDHYVVDVIAGGVYAIAAFFAVRGVYALMRRRAARTAGLVLPGAQPLSE